MANKIISRMKNVSSLLYQIVFVFVDLDCYLCLAATELSPAKYNSKLMTSIWGFYNRYSPHNIKGNDQVSQAGSYLQQSMTVAVPLCSIAKTIANGIEWNILDK